MTASTGRPSAPPRVVDMMKEPTVTAKNTGNRRTSEGSSDAARRRAFTRSLIALNDAENRTCMLVPEMPWAEDPAEVKVAVRRDMATLCLTSCPALDLCDRAATLGRAVSRSTILGVWAGRSYCSLTVTDHRQAILGSDAGEVS